MGKKMKAAIFVEKGRIVLEDKPIPDIGPQDALIRVTTTTICGTDVHILKGEYPVAKGLTVGHEPVGIIEKLGSGVTGFKEGQRVIAGAITPSGWSHACLCGCGSQDGAGAKHGWQAIGGWKFGNTIDGCQAEFVRVPDAMANLAPVDDNVSDEQVLMCPDIMSTGFAGAQTGEIKIGRGHPHMTLSVRMSARLDRLSAIAWRLVSPAPRHLPPEAAMNAPRRGPQRDRRDARRQVRNWRRNRRSPVSAPARRSPPASA
jgi:threonine dehydrogenase-like Zn-dependent dehydrogenase